LDFAQFGHVGCEGEGFASEGLDFLDDGVAAGFVGGDVVDAYIVAVVGEAERDGFAAGRS
jgi:hypothetical protein